MSNKSKRNSTLIFLILCLLLEFTTHVSAQENWAVSTLPDSIKKEANSVIRDYQVTFKASSLEKGRAKYKKVVTILNKKGEDEARLRVITDHFKTLSGFSGKLYSSQGKQIEKIKKSDLKYSEYSSSFFADDAIYYYAPSYARFPYTIAYEWELSYKHGYCTYPVFVPKETRLQAVERASYTLVLPEKTIYKLQSNLLKLHYEKQVEEGVKTETWTLKQPLLAEKSEVYAPSWRELDAWQFCVPENFSMDGYVGTQCSWKKLAQWFFLLNKGRDQLSPEFVQQLKAMTDTLSTPREKVNYLYHYLGENTRYVYIQMGIGGLQPMSASEVEKVSFGDCKGLSNYLKAMLSAINIPSFYTIINTKNKRFFSDMPNVFDSDHVILTVPFPKDTCYLECTNTSLAFGYLHSGIAGHDALLVDDTHGGLIQLPAYPDSLHKDYIKASLVLTEQGLVKTSKINHHYLYRDYEETYSIEQRTPKKQREYIKNTISIPQCIVSNVQIDVERDMPETVMSYALDNSMYTSKVGERIFIPINPFRSFSFRRSRKKRQHDLILQNCGVSCDTLEMQFPVNFQIESLPHNKHIKTHFGAMDLTTSYHKETNKIKVITRLQIKSGRYAPKEYKQWERFMRKLKRIFEEKIVVKKS